MYKGRKAAEKAILKRNPTYRQDEDLDRVINSKTTPIDPETGFHKKDPDKNLSEMEDISQVNPLFNEDNPPLGATNNCVNCSVTYEMRKRGYDVTAELSNEPVKTKSILQAAFPGAQYKVHCTYDDLFASEEDKQNLNIKTDKATIKKLHEYYEKAARGESKGIAEATIKELESQETSSGVLTCNFPLGGHALHYTVTNGNVKIEDTQIRKVYTDRKEISDMLAHTLCCSTTRLDNLDFDRDKLKGIMR